ncbi:amino acid adenylation domain-containing protein [Mucilaginibacter sp. BT774]|nr:amino acid adenylation domain-containing protein [Mucilaginibacter sp. BT774]
MPFEPELNYWTHKLKRVKPLNLFTDSARSNKKSNNKRSSEFIVDEKLREQLTKFSDEQKVTLFVTLLSAYKVLLYRYSSQDDICVGNVICNAGVNSSRHNYLSILPLRTEINNSNTFEELLQSVNATVNDAYQHQNVPFDKLTALISEDADLRSNPLYQVMFILQNGVAIPSEYTLESDVTLFVKEEGSVLKSRIEYNSDLYKEDIISRIIDHFKILLSSIIANPKKNIGLLPILTEAEEHKLLHELNNTAIEYPKDKSLIDLFEEQVNKTPDNIAVIFNDFEISYKELNILGNQFGDYLRNTYDVKPDDLIGLKLERGEWLIIAIIGILKAGGAYVPIDPDYPGERINYMINDSACGILIDGEEIERFKKVKNSYNKDNLKNGAKGNNLVYCIYTPDSTGNPKGVLVEHRNVVNLIWSQREVYKITSDERVLQFTTIIFDHSTEQFWIALLTGAALVVPDKSTVSDLKALENYIIVKKVSHIHTVPAVLVELSIDDMSNVKRVITAGETCSPSLAQKWKGSFMFINEYGPTETTITSVEYKAEQSDKYHVFVPIGRPVANTDIYILDDHQRLLPFGALGEIYIGGDGVSRGYLNRPELTKEKFIADPFKNEKRIYRTGDLGRWLPDGNLEYVGRADDQVNIRGFRIELQEIASVLRKHHKVREAIIIAASINETDNELIAYTAGDATANELKDYLKEQLPLYMVPGYYVHLDSIPITITGKVDRKALPIPESSVIFKPPHIAPSTEIEKSLVKLWAKVLNIPEKTIGLKNDFFDLGGHSIKAIRLLALIHKELGVKLPLNELFSKGTIEHQASMITNRELNTYEAIETIPEADEYRLSSAQKRLWILNHFEGAQSAYNIPYVISLEGHLNKIALTDAFRAMALRHEILRTNFKENESGAVFQEVISPDKYVFELKETDLTKNADKYAVLNQIIELESFGGFDFIEGPLWRCHLVQLEDDKHVLIMVHHHIISDGWSMDIFRKEWGVLYNAYSTGAAPQLAPLSIQYKDYAAWHNKYLHSDNLIPHKEYWLKQFEGELPILELPAEKERPAIKTFNGSCVTTTIDNNVFDKLNRIGKALGGSLFMSLLACVNALMYRYTSQEDIVIGSEIAGREHPDLGNQIGFYVNTLAIRTRFDGLGSFEALYKHVREVTLSAYEHQLYPYDELVDSLKLPRNVNRNPLFDVMVVLQNSMDQDAEFTLNGLHTSRYKTGEHRVTKYDVNFIFSESKNGLELILEYNTDIYSDTQMHRMLSHFENLLAAIAQDPKQSIAAIDILTKEDKHQLFDVFNDTLVDYPKEKTLADIFEEQVLRTPDAIALRQHDESMTYRELNERANQLAHYLIQSGVNKGDNIALLVTRNFHMIVGMFGILKAGGAYVPIDPEYPIDRQEYILQNSSVKKVVTDGEYPLASLVSPELFVRLKEIDLRECSKDNPGLKIDSTQLAYTIYTSGSTGRPKGVMIEHHMAVNLVLWVNTEFNVGPDDRLLFITSMCFDLSVYDVFGMLSAGGSLVIVQQNELLDVPRLKDMMLTYKITFWDTVPTTMDYLVRELEAHDRSYLQETLRVVFMSGDWIPVNLPDRIKVYFPNTRVISLGGATEGTVWSNFYPVERVESNWGSIPYGRPMNNNFFYILNEKLQPAPIGVVGELYIGGVGVARGYANDKEKTDYAFVKDPFSDKAGGRMYRTGDLGRMLPDLNMEFIGRKDDQVKIRGYRIELGEIESVLRQCEQVSQAVVLAKADKDKKKRLVGYLVGKENYDRASVIAFLKSKLPDYMVPTLWMEVDNIPLTANGKIDKKSLPEFNAEEQIKDQYVAPRTESENLLVKIWEDVLKVGNIGVTHDFFDLGGHSLLAVQIVNQIKKHTGKILPISVLFKYSNIESLNAFLNENDTEKISKSLVPIKPSGSKMPVYFIHGVGLNVMNFADLAMYLDKDQPVFGIQALGLGGKFPPVTTISEIAKIYVSEIIEHDPNGPYALAGYSLGGFIATEMRKQFEALNKQVVVLAIIDTYADYTDDFFTMLPKKLNRHIRKWINLGISFISSPNKTIQKQRSIYLEDKQYRYDAIKLAKESGDQEFYKLMKHIRSTYYDSYRKSKMEPFDGFVYLFRATHCLHYTDDKVYLGWKKYALKGMKEFLIPGDHRTMLLKPNVEAFARALQEVLDNASAEANKNT